MATQRIIRDDFEKVGWASRPPFGRSPNIHRGFSLIEALAALMLVALVLPFAIRGVNLSVRGASKADREATAIMLAQSQLDLVILERGWSLGDTDGEFDPELYGESNSQRFTWQLIVNDWQTTDFRELTMRVIWGEGPQQQSVELSTVVYAGA